MRTPKPGTTIQGAKAEAKTPPHPHEGRAKPWAQKARRVPDTKARSESRSKAAALYPEGKALARLRYYEAQRGIPSSILPDVHFGGTKVSRKAASRGGKPPKKPPYARAFAAKAKMAPRFSAAVALPTWQEVGPTLVPHGQTYGEGPNSQPSVSGRCVGVDIDPRNPRHIILCTAGGGLWDSHDGGATWRPLTDDQPALAMGALARSAHSPNIVYAATGEGDGQIPLGVGLLRSSDGGLTWQHVPSAALEGEAIYDIAVHPSDPLRLWIGGTHGMYSSTDGGDTVTQVRAEQTWDISINTSNPNEIFAAGESGLSLSKNGGTSWSRVTLPGAGGGSFERIEVCHAPSNPSVVYVAACLNHAAMLWRRSTATGAFAAESVPKMDTSQAWYDWCFAVSPSDPEEVFWGAIELFRGRRRGGKLAWSNISSRKSGDSIHPDHHHVAFDPLNPNILYVCNDGGLYRSPDAGTRWESLNPGLGITEFEFLAQLESDAAWIIGGTQDNGTLANVSARQWSQIALGDGGDCAVQEGGNALCFHSYYGMWIERAFGKGPDAFKWEDASPPASESYPALFYPPMDLAGNTLAKAGITVFVSDDAGTSWAEVALPTSSAAQPNFVTALSFAGGGVLLAGTTAGRIYQIQRGRSGWDSAAVAALGVPRRNGFVSDIVVAAPNVLWASVSTIRGPHVFRSSDGGASWTDRTGNMPDIPVNALVVDPNNPNVIYAATDHGVYKTADGGAKWADFSNGLPNAIVGDLLLHNTRRLLRAGTRNRGVWEVAI